MKKLEPGDEFAGYRIERVAGRGGMGVVFEATDLRLKRSVALKVIKPNLVDEEGFRERFERESELAASLDHPNVIPILHAGEHEGRLYLTMRFAEGTDLGGLIADRGKLEPELAAEIIAQAGSALDEAHASGLIHRDVKPANILVQERGGGAPRVYLTDFGLTKRTSSQTGLTATGMFVGTIDYIAPEQLSDQPIDGRADVYALAAVLYHAVTGKVPYERTNDPAKMLAHVNEPPPSARSVAADVPLELEAAITRGMAKEPDDRFPSAGDLGKAAVAGAAGRRAAQAERSVGTGPASVPPPAAPPPAAPPPAAPPPAPPPTAPPRPGPPPAPPPSVAPSPQPQAARPPVTPPPPSSGPSPFAAGRPPTAGPPGRTGGSRWWIWTLGAVLLIGVVVGLLAVAGVFGGGSATAEDYVADVCGAAAELDDAGEEIDSEYSAELSAATTGVAYKSIYANVIDDGLVALEEAQGTVEGAGVPDVSGGDATAEQIRSDVDDGLELITELDDELDTFDTSSPEAFVADVSAQGEEPEQVSEQIRDAVEDNDALAGAAEDNDDC